MNTLKAIFKKNVAQWEGFRADAEYILGVVVNDYSKKLDLTVGDFVIVEKTDDSKKRKDSCLQVLTRFGHTYPPKSKVCKWNTESCGELIEILSDFTLMVACDIASFLISDPREMDRMRAPLNFNPSDRNIFVDDNLDEVMTQWGFENFDVETVSDFMSKTMPCLTRRHRFVTLDYGSFKFDFTLWQQSHVKYPGNTYSNRQNGKVGGAFHPWITDYDRYLKIITAMGVIFPDLKPNIVLTKMPPREPCALSGYWGMIHMYGAPCFAGQSKALMDSGWKPIDSIEVGDVTHSGAIVAAVVKSKVSSPNMVFDNDSGLTVTSGHPILLDGEWYRAGELFPVTRKCNSVGVVYNFILEATNDEERILNVNGFEAATLGLYCERLHCCGGFRANFYGTNRVVEAYRARLDWPNISL